jgi:hypothetical protein
VVIVTGQRIVFLGPILRRRKRFFSPLLRPYRIWDPSSLSGDKAAGSVKLTAHLNLVSWSRILRLYIYSLILLHGMVLNYLFPGTIVTSLTLC